FFSSRRRHTRFSRDWSSDVCSSDLVLLEHGDADPRVPPDLALVGDLRPLDQAEQGGLPLPVPAHHAPPLPRGDLEGDVPEDPAGPELLADPGEAEQGHWPPRSVTVPRRLKGTA